MFAIYITAGLSGTALQTSTRSHPGAPATQVHNFFPAAAGSCEHARLSHTVLYMKERRLSFIRPFFITPFPSNPRRQDKKILIFFLFLKTSKCSSLYSLYLCSYFMFLLQLKIRI